MTGVTNAPTQTIPFRVPLMEAFTDPRDVGAFLRRKIRESGMMIKDVAERVSADPSYMSHILAGRIDLGASEYFAPIAKVLALTPEEVRAIKPDAFIEMSTPTVTDGKKPEGRLGRRHIEFERPTAIFGDMQIPAMPAEVMLVIHYNKKPPKGFVVTQDETRRYWLHWPHNVPDDHTILGGLLEIEFAPRQESPTAN